MASVLKLPPIPRGEMFVHNQMTRVWQSFFRDLFRRVGGESALTNEELSTAVESHDHTVASIPSLQAALDLKADDTELAGYLPVDPETLRVGKDDNYLWISETGHLMLLGAATVFDDQQINLGIVKKGSSAPTDTLYKGSQVLAFDKAQDNIIYFTAQLSHRYKLESTVEFHLHATVPDNNAGVVRWIFTYSWADIGDSFPTASSITVDQSVAANSQDDHLYVDIGDLTGSSDGVSSLLLCSLTREGTHANDTYNNDAYLVAADFHIECDTMGSDTESAK